MIRYYWICSGLLAGFILSLASAQAAAIETGISGAPAITLLSALPQGNRNKVALGKKLFFDPVLSGDNSISCASCHNPEKGWGDGIPRAVGVPGKELGRNTPHLFNTGFQLRWFWDGRAGSLEEQALGPIQGAGEMNQNLNALIAELKRSDAYLRMFTRVFGKQGISAATITQSLAAFERTIVSSGSPFEQYLHGDKQAMTAQAKRGLALFTGKARCILCHNGPNLTDNGFHNIGVAPEGPRRK